MVAQGSLSLVIVGYGHAGRGLADELDRRGTAGWRRILVLDERLAGGSDRRPAIEVHGGVRVTAVDTVQRRLVCGGVALMYDALVLAIGADPAVDVAPAAGLARGPGGITVDPAGRTSAPGVYAIGSCADGGDPVVVADDLASLAARIDPSGDSVAALPCLAPASSSDLLSLLVEAAALASVCSEPAPALVARASVSSRAGVSSRGFARALPGLIRRVDGRIGTPRRRP